MNWGKPLRSFAGIDLVPTENVEQFSSVDPGCGMKPGRTVHTETIPFHPKGKRIFFFVHAIKLPNLRHVMYFRKKKHLSRVVLLWHYHSKSNRVSLDYEV